MDKDCFHIDKIQAADNTVEKWKSETNYSSAESNKADQRVARLVRHKEPVLGPQACNPHLGSWGSINSIQNEKREMKAERAKQKIFQ